MSEISTWLQVFGVIGLFYLAISTEPFYRDSLYNASISVIEAL